MWVSIGIAACLTMLILLVQHWFPWRKLIRRELPRLAAYSMGVLGLIIPLTGLFLFWQYLAWELSIYWEWGMGIMAAIAVWAVVLAGGVAVMLAYWIDHSLEQRERAVLAEREAETLKRRVANGTSQ
jgi:MFS family permease